eukprot:2633234-Amphidinium_carterae.1
MLVKVLDELVASDLDTFDLALCSCLHAKNSLVSQSGRSPYMGAFGRSPRVPSELLDSRNTPVSLSVDEALQKSELVRLQAMQAFLAAEQESAVRASLNRKPVHLHDWNFSPGDPIAYYRNKAATRGSGRTLRPGWIIGIFVCYDPGHRKNKAATLRGEGRNAWIHSGGRLIMVALEQIRAASGHEHWIPSERAVINQLRTQPTAIPLADDTQNLPEGVEEQMQIAPIDFEDEAYIHDVTAELLRQDARMPSTPAPLPHMAASSTDALSRDPAATVQMESKDLSVLSRGELQTASARRRSHSASPPDAATQPPTKQLRHADYVSLAQSSDDEDAWDGSEVYTTQWTGWQLRPDTPDCHQSYTATQVSSEHDSEQPESFTRREQKAIQKEIPWSVITRQSHAVVDKFITAIKKESTAWQTWDVIEPVTESEAKRILSDPQLKKRVLRSRAAYRDKSSGQVETDRDGLSVDPNNIAAKCRIVLLGHQDPDARIVDRHAPVALRSTLHLVLQVLSSGLSSDWCVVGADIATAFLQGQVSEKRPDTIYMLPPSDPLIQRSRCFPHILYRVKGNAYGLPDAPAVFAQKARECLIKTGAVVHPLDSCCYLWRQGSSHTPIDLAAIAVIHVDDLLLVHCPRFKQLDLVKQAFTWGSWKSHSASHPGTLVFLGKEIQVATDHVLLHQATFTKETKLPSTTVRGQPDEVLQGPALTEFRSLVGCLQWLSGGSRADLAAPTSLMQTSNPTRAQLRGLQQTVEFAQQTPLTGAKFVPIPLSDIVLIGYSDASFNNAAGQKSQLGLLVVAAHRDVLRPGIEQEVSLIDWRSHRSRRVTRSTLSAESIALDSVIDHVQFLSALWGLVLYDKARRDLSGYLPWLVCTDCRSLYDAISQENTVTEEKRVLIDICAMREALRDAAIHHPYLAAKPRWVPTTHQHADALTKLDKALRERFNLWLKSPRVRLSTTTGHSFLTSTLLTWSRIDTEARCYRTSSSTGPPWASVVHRRTMDIDSGEILEDDDVRDIRPDQLHGCLPPPLPRNIRTELTFTHWSENASA